MDQSHANQALIIFPPLVEGVLGCRIAACQSKRSQAQNRNLTMHMLAAKLQQIEADKRSAELEKHYGEKADVAFGSQLRSYVFQPYEMIKHPHTTLQTSNIQDVTDAGVTDFL